MILGADWRRIGRAMERSGQNNAGSWIRPPAVMSLDVARGRGNRAPFGVMAPDLPTAQALARARVVAIRTAYASPATLARRDGEAAFAALRAAATRRLRETVPMVEALCPAGYPAYEDNGIAGPGGAVGVRLSAWHAIFFAIEHVRLKTARHAPPLGVLPGEPFEVKPRRLPGGPIPPPDMDAPVMLACLTLRYDPDRGWVEVRRRIDPRWDGAVIDDHLLPCLVGFAHDAASGHVAGRDGAGPVDRPM